MSEGCYGGQNEVTCKKGVEGSILADQSDALISENPEKKVEYHIVQRIIVPIFQKTQIILLTKFERLRK